MVDFCTLSNLLHWIFNLNDNTLKMITSKYVSVYAVVYGFDKIEYFKLNCLKFI